MLCRLGRKWRILHEWGPWVDGEVTLTLPNQQQRTTLAQRRECVRCRYTQLRIVRFFQ